MPEAIMQTVIVKNTATVNDEDYSETARVPGVLWHKLGGKKSIEDGERGLALWLRQHNPRFGPDLKVTFIREEDTRQSEMMMPPPEVGKRFTARV